MLDTRAILKLRLGTAADTTRWRPGEPLTVELPPYGHAILETLR
jgi:hypothetical protein